MHLRPALPADVPALEELIRLSARGLSRDDYSDAEIETCIAHVFGVDSELLADGTYLMIEHDGLPVACGGWSRRRTLFGGDQYQGRASGLLDPVVDAAKIRAFFVHPDFARQGLGSWLIQACEEAARAAGFTRMEMMATLPGVKLYRAAGYTPGPAQVFAMPDGVAVTFVPMSKSL